MSSYQAIVNHIWPVGGKGIQEYNQGRLLGTAWRKGLCRGLVIHWMKAKKSGSNYWANEERPPEQQSLLGDYRKMRVVSSTQWAYHHEKEFPQERRYSSHQISSSTFGKQVDYTTAKELGASGLSYRPQDDLRAHQGGFASEATRIATHVAEQQSNYFILSLLLALGRGKYIGHSIGMYRHGGTFNIFDPNVGEFEAPGWKGVAMVLNGLARFEYQQSGSSQEDYWVWGFAG